MSCKSVQACALQPHTSPPQSLLTAFILVTFQTVQASPSPESGISWVHRAGVSGTLPVCSHAMVGLERTPSQMRRQLAFLALPGTGEPLIYSLKSSELMPRTEFNSGAGHPLVCFQDLRLGFLRAPFLWQWGRIGCLPPCPISQQHICWEGAEKTSMG